MTSNMADRAVVAARMARRPGHLIRRAHQLHAALWGTGVSKDVTPTQFAVLSAVAGSPACTQAMVAREASLDSSTAGSVVYRLIKRGWIEVSSDPSDRRLNLLSLTPEGAAAFDELSPFAAAMTERLVEALDDAEQQCLVELLTKLIEADERGA